MKVKIIVAFLIFIAITLGFYLYLNSAHRDIKSEISVYNTTVLQMQQDFTQNDSLANNKYLDKTIAVKGVITQIDLENHAIVLDEGLLAVFNDSIKSIIKINQKVIVKGRFIGYDDLLEELRIDQASLVE